MVFDLFGDTGGLVGDFGGDFGDWADVGSAVSDAGSWFDGIGWDDVLGAAKTVGGVAKGVSDLFGGDVKRVDRQLPVQGFRSLLGFSPELDDFIKNQFINQIIAGGSMARPALPMRRLTDAEMTSGNIFNNPALIELQRFKDARGGGQMPIADNFGFSAAQSGETGKTANDTATQSKLRAANAFRQRYAGTPYEQYADWTPEGEMQDLDFIRRLTGDESATALPGWDEATQTYRAVTPRSGFDLGTYKGAEGYRRAEDDAVRALFEKRKGDYIKQGNPALAKLGVNLEDIAALTAPTSSYYGAKGNAPYNNIQSILGEEYSAINPANRLPYNRRAAIEAFLNEDYDMVREQGRAASEELPDIFDMLVPGLALAAIGGGLGSAVTGATSAAGAPSGLSKLAGTLAKTGLSRGVGAARA